MSKTFKLKRGNRPLPLSERRIKRRSALRPLQRVTLPRAKAQRLLRRIGEPADATVVKAHRLLMQLEPQSAPRIDATPYAAKGS